MFTILNMQFDVYEIIHPFQSSVSNYDLDPHSNRRKVTGLFNKWFQNGTQHLFGSCTGVLPEVFYQLHMMQFFVYP